jgi:hypothetical protein
MAPLHWINNRTTDGRYLIQGGREIVPHGTTPPWSYYLFFNENGGDSGGDYTQIATGDKSSDLKRAAQVHHDSRRPRLSLPAYKMRWFARLPRGDVVTLTCPRKDCGKPMHIDAEHVAGHRGESHACFHCFKPSVIPEKKEQE